MVPRALLLAGLTVAFAASSHAQPVIADDPAQFRWVRGVVISLSPDTAVLQLRSENVTLSLDPSMASALRLNAIAEVHYVERNDVRSAVLVFAGAGAGQLSKRPGYSYRGVITKVKRGAVDLRVGNKGRELQLEKQTRLTDVNSVEVAIGSKAILPRLAAGQPVIVKYESQSGVEFFDSWEDALEIRFQM